MSTMQYTCQVSKQDGSTSVPCSTVPHCSQNIVLIGKVTWIHTVLAFVQHFISEQYVNRRISYFGPSGRAVVAVLVGNNQAVVSTGVVQGDKRIQL